MIAAHAAVGQGADVAILSKKRKSHMNGAQYLHRPIPAVPVTLEPFRIEYLLQGSPAGYRMKVYGPQWDGTVSPEDMTQSHSAWPIRDTYDWMWDRYAWCVKDWEATPATLKRAMETNKPDLVISSVPANLLCHKGHTFRSAKIYSTDTAVQSLPADNTVICNGEKIPRWYRISSIQGHQNTEWPDGSKPPITPMWEVLKPTDNNCDCFPEVIRTGRYGRWTKGVLSHETYDQVVDAIWKKKLEA